MKKYLLIGLVTFFANNLVAQNQKIIGNWKENYHIVRDTMADAIEEINSDPEAYRTGFKKINSDNITYREVHSRCAKSPDFE